MLGVGIGVGLQHRSGAATSGPTGSESFFVSATSGFEAFRVRKQTGTGWEPFQVRLPLMADGVWDDNAAWSDNLIWVD